MKAKEFYQAMTYNGTFVGFLKAETIDSLLRQTKKSKFKPYGRVLSV